MKFADAHAYSLDDILREANANRTHGFSTTHARASLLKDGPNQLQQRSGRTLGQMLLEQLREVMVIILFLAAAISFFLGEWIDGGVILIIVVLNTALGLWQQAKAQKAMESLKRLSVPAVRVRRDGREQSIPSPELVVGDIILVEAGNIIPADARIMESATV